ncbi:MAG: endolytic transglycosylase MltG [Candidatus Gracilibacteria bacterium]|nr:endolytic transglycosylase MltG [Candidatus Gracilibacteria bacterium]
MRRRKTHTFRAIILLAVLAGLLLYFLFQSVYNSNLKAVDVDDQRNLKFEVKQGWSVSQIAVSLEEEDLIRSAWAFKKYVEQNADDTAFQAGSFVLRKSYDIAETVEVLSGTPNEMWMTILEGWRASDIGSYLEEKGYATQQAFLDCVATCEFDYEILSSIPEDQGLEGYLFPDTYIITPATEVYGMINRTLMNLDQKLEQELRNQAEKQGRSIHEIMTMASLLEREVRGYEDRQIVAGLLWKRLEAGMGLGVDATVLYALGDWKATLDHEALQIDSPYNTRKYAGLPPGPICSPSLSSIKAALNPVDSPYWFYLTTLDTGEVIYSKNLDEHNENVYKYLR